MRKYLRTAIAALTVAVAPAAQADFVLDFQNVHFTFSQVDADSFKLRIQNFLSGPDLPDGGDWASATHLYGLGFKNIGDVTALTAVAVSENPNVAGNSWFFTKDELAAQGCGPDTTSDFKLCVFSSPVMAMTDDMTLQFDFTGATVSLDPLNPVHLKAEVMKDYGGQRGFDKVGSLMSKDMTPSSSTGSGVSSGGVPEPSSNALALLALGLMGLGFKLRSRGARK